MCSSINKKAFFFADIFPLGLNILELNTVTLREREMRVTVYGTFKETTAVFFCLLSFKIQICKTELTYFNIISF